jgi:PPOX class probable F420-dependent enzyme
MKLDTNTKLGARAAERLRDEQVIWLTTVRPDGVPQPNPVWFLWDGETVLIYSQPGARKVGHIRGNPHVALNFNSTEDGSDVVILTGEARIEEGGPLAHQNPAYLEKYRQGIQDIQMTPETMGKEYSTIIRVTPNHVRGM